MNDDDDVIIEAPDEDSEGSSEDELEAMESRADVKVTKLRKQLEQVDSERKQNLDGWQRAKADYVNALKRFEEEKNAAVQLGTLKAAMTFLPVVDSLERARGSMSADTQLPAGFHGIVKQLEGAIAKLGLSQFGAVGDVFDPMIHEALGQETTDDESKDDTVTAVLEPGWKSGEHVIRPAKVKVAHFEA